MFSSDGLELSDDVDFSKVDVVILCVVGELALDVEFASVKLYIVPSKIHCNVWPGVYGTLHSIPSGNPVLIFLSILIKNFKKHFKTWNWIWFSQRTFKV